ncbi:hypothetical protein H1P_1550011 [Hyella patelloides LEGE 07179]|uniref:Uncharacterized protein n=1 Tax=Hyella patelloides LEGE 07179 TaxID=945734 RepID=A0A563VMB5_9CYAN|nr:hypothetical protein H1P_1550011 [Hyella patelloides LEGE 07179]
MILSFKHFLVQSVIKKHKIRLDKLAINHQQLTTSHKLLTTNHLDPA